MNVLIITRGLSGCGGMETIISSMIYGMQHLLKYDVNLLVLNFSKRPPISEEWKIGLPILEEFPRVPRIFIKYVYSFKLASYLRDKRIDKVICTDEYCVLMASFARYLTGQKFTIISWLHFSLHTIKQNRLKWLRRADLNVAISNGIAKQLLELNFPEKKVDTLINFVKRKSYSLAEISNRAKLKDSRRLKFLYIGRMVCEGQKRLCDMFAGLSKLTYPWELHLVGSGEEKKLKRLSDALGISPNIVWHGWQGDPWSYITNKIGKVSCFLLTSEYEGMPMSLLEAISYGVPCISSNCPTGPSDVILEGKNGYLYETMNVNSFVEKLNLFYTDGVELSPMEIQNFAEQFYEEGYFRKLQFILSSN